jgi:hypothetical protein
MNYKLFMHHIVLFSFMSFPLKVSHIKVFNKTLSIQEYMPYLLFPPIWVFKGESSHNMSYPLP